MEIKLNDKQMRGIDMVIKAIMKKYKFLKGWELYPDHGKYDSVIFMNVIMDYQEFADTYKYYTEPSKYTFIKRTSSNPATYMGRDKKDYDSMYHEKDKSLYDEVKLIKEDIESSAKELYYNLPEEFHSTFSTESFPEQKHPRSIMITEFIDTNEVRPFPQDMT
jgi:hypothetical protein